MHVFLNLIVFVEIAGIFFVCVGLQDLAKVVMMLAGFDYIGFVMVVNG